MRVAVNEVIPALDLTAEEEQQLVDIADRVVRSTILECEAFVKANRQINTDGWRLLKAKEGIRVYRERESKLMERAQSQTQSTISRTESMSTTSSRRTSANGARSIDNQPFLLSPTHSSSQSQPRPAPLATSKSLSSSDELHDDDQPRAVSDVRKPRTVPGVLCAGVVDGTLEDAMLAVTCGNDDFSWQWRSAHLRDYARMVAPIQSRTADDPFQCLGLKWYLQDMPATFSSILNSRYFLILEASGIINADDEPQTRTGFVLLHSVDMARVPKLDDLEITRGHMSMCLVFQQLNRSSISVFGRGYMNPRGDLMDSTAIRIISNAALATSKLVDFANMKKLRWLMFHDRRSATPVMVDPESAEECKTCRKKLRRLANLMQGGCMCQVCREVVCAKCAVEKQIALDVKRGDVLVKPLLFCKECTMTATQLSAFDLASDEVVNGSSNMLGLHMTLQSKDSVSRSGSGSSHSHSSGGQPQDSSSSSLAKSQCFNNRVVIEDLRAESVPARPPQAPRKHKDKSSSTGTSADLDRWMQHFAGEHSHNIRSMERSQRYETDASLSAISSSREQEEEDEEEEDVHSAEEYTVEMLRSKHGSMPSMPRRPKSGPVLLDLGLPESLTQSRIKLASTKPVAQATPVDEELQELERTIREKVRVRQAAREQRGRPASSDANAASRRERSATDHATSAGSEASSVVPPRGTFTTPTRRS